MRCETDDIILRAGVILDREHPDLDLRQDDLSDSLLDLLVQGMITSHSSTMAPDGTPWPPLARSTVAHKHHGLIGLCTGRTHPLGPGHVARDAAGPPRGRRGWSSRAATSAVVTSMAGKPGSHATTCRPASCWAGPGTRKPRRTC